MPGRGCVRDCPVCGTMAHGCYRVVDRCNERMGHNTQCRQRQQRRGRSTKGELGHTGVRPRRIKQQSLLRVCKPLAAREVANVIRVQRVTGRTRLRVQRACFVPAHRSCTSSAGPP